MSGKFLVVVAIVLGAIVVLLLNSMISDYEQKANPPTRTFYRATADIAPGITVADAMADSSRLLVAEKNIPEGFAKAYSYAVDEFQMEYTKKRKIVRPIKAGEFLVQEHLEPAVVRGHPALDPRRARGRRDRRQRRDVGQLPRRAGRRRRRRARDREGRPQDRRGRRRSRPSRSSPTSASGRSTA